MSIVKRITIVIFLVLVFMGGCAHNKLDDPQSYIGVKGHETGFNNNSREQAFAECRYEADQALNEEIKRTGSPIFGAEAKSRTMRGCMQSKGFQFRQGQK